MNDTIPEDAPTREPRYAAGFTAIGIIVLAAAIYAIRLARDPGAGNDLLTATFLIANAVGWLLGSILRRRDPRSIVGLLLVLMGDAIFPLNLFAPMMLYTPGLRGDAAASATAVILIGIVYHLWNYQRRSSVRFALPFYPYFFAMAGAAALALTHYTLHLPLWISAWLVLAYALAFNELSFRRRPEPDLHFAIGAAVVLTLAAGVAFWAYADRHPAALAAIVASAALAIASAFRERRDAAKGRAHGLAAWLAVTATFTALLYAAHSELPVYYVATGLWTIVLVVVSMLPERDWSDPFRESAWWAAMLLAFALAIALWQLWMPLIVRTMLMPASVTATTFALFEAGMAMAAVSVWRRRHPPIAASLRGFVTNNFLLRLSSYAAPLLLVLAIAGAWSVAGAPSGNVWALVAAGMLLLIAGPAIERWYPTDALDFAGVLAMIFAAFNALSSVMLSAAVLFAAALIYLARHLRTRSRWAFIAFLALTIAGLTLQNVGTPAATAIFLIAALVIGWASTRATPVAARIGFALAHSAGVLFWISLARALSLGRPYDAAVLAVAAWFAFAAYRATSGLASRTSLHVCIVLMLASFTLLAWWPAVPAASLVALIALGALLLELPYTDLLGFALLIAAVVMAAEQPDSIWLVAVLTICAAVLLRRSFSRKSAIGHLLFIACAVAAAYVAMPMTAVQTVPFVALVAILLLIEILALRMSAASSFHADVTSVIALVLAVTVLFAEVVSTRFAIGTLAALLLALLLIRPWIAASDTHRLQPVAHAMFVAVGIVAVAVILVAAARLFGLTPAQQLLVLSACAVAVLALLVSRAVSAKGPLAVALHIIALSVYVAAFRMGGADPLTLLACAIVVIVYVAWRAAWRMPVLEHLAGFGFVLTICLWGVAREMAWPEIYLFAAAGYLCVMLLRGTAHGHENTIAIIAIAAALAYPCIELWRTGEPAHLAFLGIAAVLIIHVLLTARRHMAMVLAACLALGLGMLFGAVSVRDDIRLNLLMAIVGFLVIADLGVIGMRSSRRAVVGEIVGESEL